MKAGVDISNDWLLRWETLSTFHTRCLEDYHQLNQHAIDGEDIEVGPGEIVDRDSRHLTTTSRLYR